MQPHPHQNRRKWVQRMPYYVSVVFFVNHTDQWQLLNCKTGKGRFLQKREGKKKKKKEKKNYLKKKKM